MRCLPLVVAVVGVVAIQKPLQQDIESKVNNLEDMLADKEREVLEEIQAKVSRQKAEYESLLLAQREKIRKVQADNANIWEQLKPTEESIEDLHKNASEILMETEGLGKTLKKYAHDIDLAHKFALTSVKNAERRFDAPELQILSDESGVDGKAGKLSELIEDNGAEWMANLASDPTETSAENADQTKLTSSFDKLMKQSTSYYEHLEKRRDALKERLASAKDKKDKVSAVERMLNVTQTGLLGRVETLRAFGQSLDGQVDLPEIIAKFEEK